MDPLWLFDLDRINYQERLREAEKSRKLWQSDQFRKLPKLVQSLIVILT